MANYEVEQKFRVGEANVRSQLLAQADIVDQVTQVDTYFAHPARDFAETDEALRIRQIESHNVITYKGPRRAGSAVKTREEIEVALESGADAAEKIQSVWIALGFRKVASVRKRRLIAELSWRGSKALIALDEVDGLGSFVEVELVVEENALDKAESIVQSLAEALELSEVEPRSYLEMVLEKQAN